jgi:hypothetical protein
MVNYVNTVLVSNLSYANAGDTILTTAPAAASALNTPSADAGKFIIMNCDPNVASTKLYEVTSSNAGSIQTIKVGIVTKKNMVLRKPDGSTAFQPIVKWSNEIKAADIKSYSALSYAADTEDTAYIDFSQLAAGVLAEYAKGGKRIIVRLTYKDMPHRFRKWTESYEYVTAVGDTEASIVSNIANMINKEWKRARVQAVVGAINTTAASGTAIDGTNYFHTDANFGTSTATTGEVLQLIALPYDDDDSVDSLSWANKVRFNVNLYWTDPAGEGWEANNKHFPQGVTIEKVPGKQYPASAKLVRDRESWGMGYQGILNRGEGTWPIIKPDMETQLDKHYNALTLEFENMYRAADDIQRKTKQVLEVYAVYTAELKAVLDAFVAGTQQDEALG